MKISILVSVIQIAFAFTALQSIINLSIVGQTVKVLAGFTIAQIVYFFVIRWRYMIHLREAVGSEINGGDVRLDVKIY